MAGILFCHAHLRQCPAFKIEPVGFHLECLEPQRLLDARRRDLDYGGAVFSRGLEQANDVVPAGVGLLECRKLDDRVVQLDQGLYGFPLPCGIAGQQEGRFIVYGRLPPEAAEIVPDNRPESLV